MNTEYSNGPRAIFVACASSHHRGNDHKHVGSVQQLTCCLAAISGNDFVCNVFTRRFLMKLILDRLLKQHKGLMIFNKIERVTVTCKYVFNIIISH